MASLVSVEARPASEGPNFFFNSITFHIVASLPSEVARPLARSILPQQGLCETIWSGRSRPLALAQFGPRQVQPFGTDRSQA